MYQTTLTDLTAQMEEILAYNEQKNPELSSSQDYCMDTIYTPYFRSPIGYN